MVGYRKGIGVHFSTCRKRTRVEKITLRVTVANNTIDLHTPLFANGKKEVVTALFFSVVSDIITDSSGKAGENPALSRNGVN
jgi:hypothetical protein